MPLKPFEIRPTTMDTGVIIMVLTGNMTMGEQLQTLEHTVRDHAKNQQSRMIFDMAGIGYIDSSALGTLVSCHSMLKNAGGQLRLAALTERVAKIIKLGGVDCILHIDPNCGAAVTALG